MNLKKTLKQGVCSANRCKVPAQADGDNPFGLCNQHYNEWVSENRPQLGAAPPKEKLAKTETPDATLAKITETIQPARTSAEEMLRFCALVPLDLQVQIAHGGPHMSGLEALGAIRETARLQLKNVEERRKADNAPLLEQKRKIDEAYKPLKETCESIVRTCTDRLQEYANAQAAARTQALQAVNFGDRSPEVLAVAHGDTAAPLPPEVTTRTKFGFKVVNLDEVPRAFMVLDEKLVQQYIDAKKGQCTIPGLEVFEFQKVQTS